MLHLRHGWWCWVLLDAAGPGPLGNDLENFDVARRRRAYPSGLGAVTEVC